MKAVLCVAICSLAASLVGCVSQELRDFRAYEAQQLSSAKGGTLKWSDFYKDMYSRLAASDIRGKGFAMEQYNTLIMAATLYERGSIDAELFATVQRTIEIQGQQAADAQRARAAAIMGQALQNYGNTVYGPAATRAQQLPLLAPIPAVQPPRQTDCTTYQNRTSCLTQ